ncbi:Mobile element protein [Kitasatospora purpeofusca]
MAGYRLLLDLLAEHGDTEAEPIDAACQAGDDLAEAVEAVFREPPDADIHLSFPGLGVQLAARVLAEIGDYRARFAIACGLKAYAGSAPITRASGKKSYVGRRMVKNNRLMHAGFLRAFSSLHASPGADAHRRREHRDWHAGAQRNLLNRPLGRPFHCPQDRIPFDENHAFTSPLPSSTTAAARLLGSLRCLSRFHDTVAGPDRTAARGRAGRRRHGRADNAARRPNATARCPATQPRTLRETGSPREPSDRATGHAGTGSPTTGRLAVRRGQPQRIRHE